LLPSAAFVPARIWAYAAPFACKSVHVVLDAFCVFKAGAITIGAVLFALKNLPSTVNRATQQVPLDESAVAKNA
jgi:hypothetical protein